MIEMANPCVWAIVAAGGVLALLSLIMTVSLWVMMGAPRGPITDTSDAAGQEAVR